MEKKNQIIKLTIPLFFELLLMTLVQNVDQFMLSAYSKEAVSAIGNAGQISWVMILFFNVFATASMILITQYKGAQNEEAEKTIYPITILSNVVIGVIISLICIFGIDFILNILNVEKGITFTYAKHYMQITGGMILFQGIYACFSAFLKSNELVKEAMVISILVNILNVIGNALALYILKWGVAGVALSTGISRLVGMILSIVIFYRKIGKINFYLSKGTNPMHYLKQLLHIGVPSVGENISYDTSQLCVLAFINTMGLAAVNAKVYVTLVIQFAYLFTMSLTEAMQIVEGYLLGAGNKDEASKKVFHTYFISILSSVSLTILIYVFSDYIIGLFPSADATVLAYAKQILFIEIFLEIGRAMNMTMVRALQSAGDVRYPVIMSIIFTWCLSVTLGYVFGVSLHWGLVGIWIAMALDENLRGIVLTIRFKRGKWRKISLVEKSL